MCADEAPLVRIAAALADGRRVDWAQAQSSAATPDDQNMIEQLRVVAKVAAVHWAAAEQGAAAPSGEPLVPHVEPSPAVD